MSILFDSSQQLGYLLFHELVLLANLVYGRLSLGFDQLQVLQISLKTVVYNFRQAGYSAYFLDFLLLLLFDQVKVVGQFILFLFLLLLLRLDFLHLFPLSGFILFVLSSHLFAYDGLMLDDILINVFSLVLL